MKNLSYDQDGNSGFIIESETNKQVGVVWTDTEDEEEINELEKLTKLFVASTKMINQLIYLEDYVNRSLTLSGLDKKDIDFILKNPRKVIEKALS